MVATTIPGLPAPAVANPPTYAADLPMIDDTMGRNVPSGWGKSPNGVNYIGENSSFSVDPSGAKVALTKPGRSRTIRADKYQRDARASITVSTDKIAETGNGVYTSLHLRHTDDGFYRTVLRIRKGGTATLEVSRSDDGKITTLGAPKKLPFSVKAGQPVSVLLETTGTESVSIRAKAWLANKPQPTTWDSSYTDHSAERISGYGTPAVSAYLSRASPPSSLTYDNFSVVSMKVQEANSATVSRPSPTPTTPEKPETPQAVGSIPGWGTPDWQDEFNSGTEKWNVRNNDTLSYDKARIMKDNVTVSDGLLHITAKRQTVGGRDFTTGYLDSIGKFEQQYGRWEIRAKIPTTKGESRGIWPAFWLRNKGLGEVDIMEAWGDPFTNPTSIGTSSLTAHESTKGGGERKAWNWENEAGATEHSALDFHTWAIEYTPTEMKGYFDGKLVVTATKEQYPWLWGSNFQTPMNMRLNLQIGSPYHGYPTGPDYKDTKLPADYQVDYVRAWEYQG